LPLLFEPMPWQKQSGRALMRIWPLLSAAPGGIEAVCEA